MNLYRTVFTIPQLDCPAEEQLIKMHLAQLPQVKQLIFDLARHQLTVLHSGQWQDIEVALQNLNLKVTFCHCQVTNPETDPLNSSINQAQQRHLLIVVLVINLLFFFAEVVFGILADSMGLLADGLDMLADSLVYGMALFVVGSKEKYQRQVARISGYFQLSLAMFGFAETLRRFVGQELVPHFGTMMTVSFFALLGNAISFYLLQKNQNPQAHMQASLIFTSSDMIANAGVILAGFLVWLLDSKIPDLIIGLIVFFMVTRGALRILKISS